MVLRYADKSRDFQFRNLHGIVLFLEQISVFSLKLNINVHENVEIGWWFVFSRAEQFGRCYKTNFSE